MRHTRTYTTAERAEAVALAATIGPLKAAKELGYPPRTVASWMHMAPASPIIAAAEATIAERLRQAHAQALLSVMQGLQDPNAKLGERARALEVLGEQLALAEGRATSNNFNLNVNAEVMSYDDTADLRAWLDAVDQASDEELAEAAPGIVERIRSVETLKQHGGGA